MTVGAVTMRMPVPVPVFLPVALAAIATRAAAAAITVAGARTGAFARAAFAPLIAAAPLGIALGALIVSVVVH